MDHYIITGASRGIGEALAKAVAGPGTFVQTLSRGPVPELEAYFAHEKGNLLHHIVDLTNDEAVRRFAGEAIACSLRKEPDGIFLINNAALLEPVIPCGQEDPAVMEAHIRVNLIAPMILTSAFIRLLGHLDVPKTVVNISSGAGRNPYAGWSSYCSSKAGLDMFTRCVALEQAGERFPVKIIAIGPGIVDTDMQSLLRGKSEKDFPMKPKFIQLKESGKLSDPAGSASLLLRALKDVPSGTVSDVRELYGG
ncbi:MAG: SDR family NAD(P)-dependent oxidoreductase [Bacteroidales bacterium]|nr:SDR family NAD(P)-dependent oxidoreductase [Bacteroidales bacterium]